MDDGGYGGRGEVADHKVDVDGDARGVVYKSEDLDDPQSEEKQIHRVFNTGSGRRGGTLGTVVVVVEDQRSLVKIGGLSVFAECCSSEIRGKKDVKR